MILTFTSNLSDTLVCATIQMKAIEQYFHVVLFIMLYKVILTFKSVDETIVCVTIQMKAVEQYFHEVLFIMLYFSSVNCFPRKILSECTFSCAGQHKIKKRFFMY